MAMNKDLFVGAYIVPALKALHECSTADYSYRSAEMARLEGMITGAHLCGLFTYDEQYRLKTLVYSAGFRSHLKPFTVLVVA